MIKNLSKSFLLGLILFLTPVFAAEISITMDDFNIQESTLLNSRERNDRILGALKKNRIEAGLFVSCTFIQEKIGRDLLQEWNAHGHLIGNHTFSHYKYGAKMSLEAYVEDILKCEDVLKRYSKFSKIFRFPYLAEGDTARKRDDMRLWLSKSGYKNGYATVDSSDWYIDQRMREKLKVDPQFDLTKYRDFYLEHIWDRSKYYNELSKKVLGREVKHTLVIHFNLLNALFLGDLVEMFKKRGWVVIDASRAFSDPVFSLYPKSIPSGQSVIWALAKESGKFEDQLRYPGEDGVYEKDKMDKLGL